MLKIFFQNRYFYECTINQIETYPENSRKNRNTLENLSGTVFVSGMGEKMSLHFQIEFPDLENKITGSSVKYEFQVKNKNISL